MNELLFNRAVNLLMDEFGMTKERVISWLQNDEQFNDWEYGGEWKGIDWIEDRSNVNYLFPKECRTKDAGDP